MDLNISNLLKYRPFRISHIGSKGLKIFNKNFWFDMTLNLSNSVQSIWIGTKTNKPLYRLSERNSGSKSFFFLLIMGFKIVWTERCCVRKLYGVQVGVACKLPRANHYTIITSKLVSVKAILRHCGAAAWRASKSSARHPLGTATLGMIQSIISDTCGL
jgi:hypothetical protein